MRKGFTLTELLVVLAALAVQGAVVGTGLKGARDEATRAADMANYKQYPLMWNMWGFDHNGRLPWTDASEWPDALGGAAAMNDRNHARYGGYKNPLNWHDGRMNTQTFPCPWDKPQGKLTPEADGRDRCYWNCTPDDDPNRNCMQTVFCQLADYCGSPKIFTMPSDEIDAENELRPCYVHDGVGPGSSCCGEELAMQDPTNEHARSCWYGGDGIGGAHCEGWTVYLMYGYQGCDVRPVDLYGTWTLDQWKMNATGVASTWRPETEPQYRGTDYGNPEFGPGERFSYTEYYREGTTGKDGALICRSVEEPTGAMVEVAGSTRTLEDYATHSGRKIEDVPTYLRKTVDGLAVYTNDIHTGTTPTWANQVRFGGWKELIEMELGTHHTLNYIVE